MRDGPLQEKPAQLARAARWLVVCAVAWLIMGELQLGNALLAVAVVLAAALVGLAGAPAREANVSLMGALRFAPFFLLKSIEGGWDVAKRAFRGRSAIAPDVMQYRSAFHEGTSAVPAFAVLVTLVPGTLCVQLEGAVLTLHVVDRRQDVEADVRAIEQALARVFPGSTREAIT